MNKTGFQRHIGQSHPDEFPARADLLFDTTCSQHLPLDILWSVAMMSILPLL